MTGNYRSAYTYSGFFAGAVVSVVGSIKFGGNRDAQFTVAAVLGGTASVLGGGKFANGAVSAAFVVMFNHWHTAQSQVKVDELSYPDPVNLHAADAVEKLLEWAKFIEDNKLRDISIGRIIDFGSLRTSDQKYDAKYYGLVEYGEGSAEWSTRGFPTIKSRRLISGVSPVALSNGKDGHINYSFIFEGYPIYGNSSPTNLFQVKFNSYETFENAFHTIYGQDKSPWWIEGR